jgi:hypothetical protein
VIGGPRTRGFAPPGSSTTRRVLACRIGERSARQALVVRRRTYDRRRASIRGGTRPGSDSLSEVLQMFDGEAVRVGPPPVKDSYQRRGHRRRGPADRRQGIHPGDRRVASSRRPAAFTTSSGGSQRTGSPRDRSGWTSRRGRLPGASRGLDLRHLGALDHQDGEAASAEVSSYHPSGEVAAAAGRGAGEGLAGLAGASTFSLHPEEASRARTESTRTMAGERMLPAA